MVGWGIVLMGLVHMAATPRYSADPTAAGLWFLSGGMMIALVGALNLLNRAYGRSAPGLRIVCVVANVNATAFAVVAGIVTGATLVEFALILALYGAATALSLTRGALSARTPG